MPLIVFEGLDGSGKSTLMNALQDRLQKMNLPTLMTREPGGTPLGEEIRHIILRTQNPSPRPRTELLLYAASRAQHVDEFLSPQLQKGSWVLCDRFTASTVAFQSEGRQIDRKWIDRLNDFATLGLKADLTVLLDLSVQESRQRRKRRVKDTLALESEDRIESEGDSFHNRVRKSFLEMASQEASTWLVLDASQPPEELLRQLLSDLKKRDIQKGLEWPEF